MFVVTSWPCRIVTAGMRPMTWPDFRRHTCGIGVVERDLADRDVLGDDRLTGRDGADARRRL